MQALVADLKEEYLQRLAERNDRFIKLWNGWQQGDTEAGQQLSSDTHKLAGSAGMYELEQLGQAARTLCYAIREEAGSSMQLHCWRSFQSAMRKQFPAEQ